MSDEVKKKVSRRGIATAKGTADLKFHEKDAASNGLFIGNVAKVSVDWRTIGEDAKGLESFRGLSIPRFALEFVSTHAKAEEKRHAYLNLLPVESNVDTIPNGSSEWQVTAVFNTIKHILDVFYLKGREFTEAEAEALTLPFEDFDENFEYVSVEPEVVIKGYQVIFENACAMLNGEFTGNGEATGKSAFKDDKGNPIKVWAKMLRYQKTKNEWKAIQNGDLTFPRFVGECIFEKFDAKTQVPTILRYNPATESITPKEVKKAPTMPGAVAPAIGGVTPIAPMGGFTPSFEADNGFGGDNDLPPF